MLSRKTAQREIGLSQIALSHLLVVHLHLFHFDVILIGKMQQSFAISEVVKIHQETNRVTAIATSEAMAKVFARRYHKRRCTLVVKRAQPLVVCSGTSQTHIVAYHIHYVGGTFYMFYRRLVYHTLISKSPYFCNLQKYKKNGKYATIILLLWCSVSVLCVLCCFFD